MSYSIGWIPGAPHSNDTPLCARCQHHADQHLRPGSCSVRLRWWRRCPCTGYARTLSPAPANQ